MNRLTGRQRILYFELYEAQKKSGKYTAGNEKV